MLPAPKRISTGEKIKDIKSREMKKKEMQEAMYKYIEDIVWYAEEADKLIFYFVHVNYFYSRQKGNGITEYSPAEIGIARCSLREGVKAVYHAIITPKIDKGYTADAIDRSDSYFQLPTDSGGQEITSSKELNAELYDEINEFLSFNLDGDHLPPLYTVFNDDSFKDPAIYFFEKLAVEKGFNPMKFRVYSIEVLFFNLYNIKSSKKMEVKGAYAFLKKDPYEYTKSAACEFHQGTDAINHCSKAIAQRFMFTICDHCCALFKIKRIFGCHKPHIETTIDENENLMQNLHISVPKETQNYNMNSLHTEVDETAYSMGGWNLITSKKTHKSEMNSSWRTISRTSRSPSKRKGTAPVRKDHSTATYWEHTNRENNINNTAYENEFPIVNGNLDKTKQKQQQKKSFADLLKK